MGALERVSAEWVTGINGLLDTADRFMGLAHVPQLHECSVMVRVSVVTDSNTVLPTIALDTKVDARPIGYLWVLLFGVDDGHITLEEWSGDDLGDCSGFSFIHGSVSYVGWCRLVWV